MKLTGNSPAASCQNTEASELAGKSLRKYTVSEYTVGEYTVAG
jgi:hypothetical protein